MTDRAAGASPGFAADRTAPAPAGVWSAPGPGQPHRRAHRLQRGLRAAVRDRPPHRRRPRRRATTAVIRVASAPSPTSVAEIAARRARRRTRCAAGPPTRSASPGRSAQRGADLAAVPGLDLVLRLGRAGRAPGCRPRPRIECAVAVALERAVAARPRPRARWPGSAQLAENESVGAPTGIMDQSAVAARPPDRAVFLDCRSLESELVPLGFAEAGLELLVIDTKVEHAARHRRVRARGARPASGARGARRRALRDVGVDDLPRAPASCSTTRPSAACGTSSPRTSACSTPSRRCAADGPAGDRRAAGRLARLDARRLRDLGPRARPRRRDRPGQRRDRRPDDRRRLRRGRRSPSSGATAISRIQVAIDGAFAEHGFAQPTMFTVTASDGAHRD